MMVVESEEEGLLCVRGRVVWLNGLCECTYVTTKIKRKDIALSLIVISLPRYELSQPKRK